jgi:fatty acid-binding protein DegV
MYVHLGDRSFRDGVDLSPRQLYERLSAGAAPATTSTPAPADFLAAFRGSEADEILCVTVAASMSSSHGQAIAAAEEFPGTVEVVDSLSASMAEGFVAMAAARTAAQGAPLAQVARRARAAAAATRLFATVDTFEHLQRSGRVSRLQAYAATAMDIKPVFAFREGRPSALARPGHGAARWTASSPRRSAPPRVDPCGWPPSTRWRRTRPTRWPTASRPPSPCWSGSSSRVTPVVGVHVGPGLVGAAIHPDPG